MSELTAVELAVEKLITSVTVKTWFDLGLMLDNLADERAAHEQRASTAAEVRSSLASSVLLITTDANRVPQLHGQINQALGDTAAVQAHVVGQDADVLPGTGLGADWALASGLFKEKLQRGGDRYNELILAFWDETLAASRQLAKVVADSETQLIVTDGLHANPVQPAQALAVVLVSEALALSVVSINDDFHWRDTSAQWQTNNHLGEVYALFETVFPWDGPNWAHVIGNGEARLAVTQNFGFCPGASFAADGFDAAINYLADALSESFAQEIETPIAAAFEHCKAHTQHNEEFEALALCQGRKYLPGLTELEYMVYLKSLIDPSSFRIEEKEIRGRVYLHALALVAAQEQPLSAEIVGRFWRQCVALFTYHKGEDELVVDHSLSYRHRQSRHYPWRKMTEPELKGVVGQLFRGVCATDAPVLADTQKPADFVDLMTRMAGADLAIDVTERLEERLASGRPIVWVPDADFASIADAWLQEVCRRSKATIYVLVKRAPSTGSPSTLQFSRWIADQASALTQALAEEGRIIALESEVLSTGTHLAQLGAAAAELVKLKDASAIVVSQGHDNMLTLDLLDMESFRFGRCRDLLEANYMGLADDNGNQTGEGYLLWVPAGLRPSLAYPTPIQKPAEFAVALDSDDFRRAVAEFGEAALLAKLREDADQYGTPVARYLSTLLASAGEAGADPVDFQLLTGLHSNGAPWSGAYAKIAFHPDADHQWGFHTVFAQDKSDTVINMIKRFEKNEGDEVSLAWNGGYILNGELVGKLGLPEDYIGSPLGLLIENGKVLSLPLYNKPALAFAEGGDISIREANLESGLSIAAVGGDRIDFSPAQRNTASVDQAVFYDLLDGQETAPADGRTLYRFAGKQIIQVLTGETGDLPLVPVGLTVAVPAGQEPAGWVAGADMEYEIPGWGDVVNAIEAGPRLVRSGKESIEMQQGGWKTQASIRTQAARLDYTHMRGPKIAVGLTYERELLIVAVNGRIRESVGATHIEVADILLKMGAVEAMGFDPGGSVTLVVHGEQLNISPYNKDYLNNSYSLPPQARFVGNAILGVLEEPSYQVEIGR